MHRNDRLDDIFARLADGGTTAALRFGRRCRTRSADALEQHRGGLVVRVLGDQLAAEGLGEQGGRQALDLGAGGGVAGFEAVGVGEEGFDAADDFGLLRSGGIIIGNRETLEMGAASP